MEVIYLKMLRWQKINGHLLVGIHAKIDTFKGCENIMKKELTPLSDSSLLNEINRAM